MSMTLKTTKNMWRGLSVVYKITTRRSTIDVRKKSDLFRKNLTNGSPGLVRKIWDWPQPGQVLSRGWRCSWSSADRRCSNYIWVINRLVVYQGATYIRGLTVSLACCSPAHGNGLTQLSPLTTTSQATAATITTPNNTRPPREGCARMRTACTFSAEIWPSFKSNNIWILNAHMSRNLWWIIEIIAGKTYVCFLDRNCE